MNENTSPQIPKDSIPNIYEIEDAFSNAFIERELDEHATQEQKDEADLEFVRALCTFDDYRNASNDAVSNVLWTLKLQSLRDHIFGVLVRDDIEKENAVAVCSTLLEKLYDHDYGGTTFRDTSIAIKAYLDSYKVRIQSEDVTVGEIVEMAAPFAKLAKQFSQLQEWRDHRRALTSIGAKYLEIYEALAPFHIGQAKGDDLVRLFEFADHLHQFLSIFPEAQSCHGALRRIAADTALADISSIPANTDIRKVRSHWENCMAYVRADETIDVVEKMKMYVNYIPQLSINQLPPIATEITKSRQSFSAFQGDEIKHLTELAVGLNTISVYKDADKVLQQIYKHLSNTNTILSITSVEGLSQFAAFYASTLHKHQEPNLDRCAALAEKISQLDPEDHHFKNAGLRIAEAFNRLVEAGKVDIATVDETIISSLTKVFIHISSEEACGKALATIQEKSQSLKSADEPRPDAYQENPPGKEIAKPIHPHHPKPTSSIGMLTEHDKAALAHLEEGMAQGRKKMSQDQTWNLQWEYLLENCSVITEGEKGQIAQAKSILIETQPTIEPTQENEYLKIINALIQHGKENPDFLKNKEAITVKLNEEHGDWPEQHRACISNILFHSTRLEIDLTSASKFQHLREDVFEELKTEILLSSAHKRYVELLTPYFYINVKTSSAEKIIEIKSLENKISALREAAPESSKTNNDEIDSAENEKRTLIEEFCAVAEESGAFTKPEFWPDVQEKLKASDAWRQALQLPESPHEQALAKLANGKSLKVEDKEAAIEAINKYFNEHNAKRKLEALSYWIGTAHKTLDKNAFDYGSEIKSFLLLSPADFPTKGIDRRALIDLTRKCEDRLKLKHEEWLQKEVEKRTSKYCKDHLIPQLESVRSTEQIDFLKGQETRKNIIPVAINWQRDQIGVEIKDAEGMNIISVQIRLLNSNGSDRVYIVPKDFFPDPADLKKVVDFINNPGSKPHVNVRLKDPAKIQSAKSQRDMAPDSSPHIGRRGASRT